jgi:hypothetical protein
LNDIDGYVLGRFQRLSEILERSVGFTCFSLARVCLFVSTVLNVCAVYRLSQGDKPISRLSVILISCLFIFGAHKLFQLIARAEGCMLRTLSVGGRNRQGEDPGMKATRLGCMMGLIVNCALGLTLASPVVAVLGLSWLYLAAILYLASCTPLQKRETE